MPRLRTSALRRRSVYGGDRISTASRRRGRGRFRGPGSRSAAQRLAALQRRLRGVASSSASSRSNDEASGCGEEDEARAENHLGGGRKSLAERTSLIVERVGEIRVPVLQVPDLYLAPYGVRWAMDILVFLNNAIRREIADLFVILASLQTRILEVEAGELRQFFAWYSSFETFVVTVLKAEEEFLYPFIERKKRKTEKYDQLADIDRLHGDLSTASRMTAKGTIIRLVRDASATANYLHGYVRPGQGDVDLLSVGFVRQEGDRQCADILRELIDLAKDFAARLEKYFTSEERVLPDIIELKYSEYEARQLGIMRHLARAVWKGCRKDESTVMMVRWMECRAEVRGWCSHVLRGYERMAFPIWKKRFDNGRGRLVKEFASRRAGYETEVEYAKRRRPIDVTRKNLERLDGTGNQGYSLDRSRG